MEYRGEQVATGMQFVGCIMGDYAKTAINTASSPARPSAAARWSMAS